MLLPHTRTCGLTGVVQHGGQQSRQAHRDIFSYISSKPERPLCACVCVQVWVSLLRVTQPEQRRGLMREVLDTLIPTLVAKLGSKSPDGKVAWVR